MTNKEKAESAKLQQHLALLKEEYVKLQTHCNELERKYALACVAAGEVNENSFVSNLVHKVSGLFDKELYSDMTVKVSGRSVPAHRLVLAARGDTWGSLAGTAELDWTHLPADIGLAMLKWLYTDQADLSRGDSFTLDLMRTANDFKLDGLVAKCEKVLMASVNVRNCVRFYTTADEINALALKEHCSGLISAHWDDFTSEDFAHMSAPLLYSMFKSKTGFPLHAAVRLNREDVVFLYLVEHTADLGSRLNAADARGDLPLDLALRAPNPALAAQLLEHGADPDARDAAGDTLLLRAARRRDASAAAFLLERGAAPAAAGPSGDTALHLAAAAADAAPLAELAGRLLAAGADPNLQNRDGYTPLHLAVLARNGAVLDLLLAHPAPRIDVNARTADGHPALWFALLAPAAEAAAAGADPDDDGDEGDEAGLLAAAKAAAAASDGAETGCGPPQERYPEDCAAARLLAAGAAPNPAYPAPSADGDRLLHRLAREGLEGAALFVAERAPSLELAAGNNKGESALHVACERGLARLVTRLLERGAAPNAQTLPGAAGEGAGPHRESALHVAVRSRQEAAVRALVDFAAAGPQPPPAAAPDFNLKDSSGSTALAVALASGQQRLVPLLLRGGADVNVRNGRGLTLLHQALQAADPDTALFLLEQGADLHALAPPPAAATPLQLAIRARLPTVVEALCRRGVDLSAAAVAGATDRESADPPLWEALASGQPDIASILVRHGADTDCWGPGPEGCLQTLLHRAIDENNEAIAKFLIQSGCDLNSPRRPGPGGTGADEAKDQAAPLHLCCQWGLELAAQVLVEHGANVNQRDAEGKTPLHVAIENQHAGIISLLLCHPGLDLTLRNKVGLTPFATALTVRNTRAAQAILDRLPTAAEQSDNKGRNFLHTAIQKRDVESVLFLLSVHVDVNSRVQDPEQTPPLQLAATAGDELLVRSLILAGARVNDRDAHRRTALHVAAASGHTVVVSALLQNGADFDAADSDGDNALHAAAREGQLGAARALLTESQLDAEAVNLKGRNPLHVLARHARDNAAAICELFLECMPKYPLDKPDLDGNTALLLAYMKGNGNLCRSLVKAGACLGSMNKEGITIFNYQVATKQLLYRLLDHLSQEPPWAEGDICLECGIKFGLTMRKHHCRHCGRILCSKCSGRDVPILKFSLNKPVRVCGVCFDVLQVGST